MAKKGSVQKKAVMMTRAAEHRLPNKEWSPNTDEAVKTLRGDTFERAMTLTSENSGRWKQLGNEERKGKNS